MKVNWNYFTKQKGIVIVSLVMCLVILASANYIYTNSQNKIPDIEASSQDKEKEDESTGKGEEDGETKGVVATADYFESYRKNRQSIRDLEMRYVQTVADNEKSDAEVKKEAEARLIEIASLMEKEMKIESRIVSKGFADAICFVEDGAINVVIKAETISSADATKILKIVVDETGELSQNITIITRV